jgi:hypothetical protein
MRRRAAAWRQRFREARARAHLRSYESDLVGVDTDQVMELVDENYAERTNPFSYYCELIQRLASLPDAQLLPLRDLARSRAKARRQIGLRHDVDADPITAVRCARLLAREGLSGSFYLLHTAPYYGALQEGRMVHNAALRGWIDDLIVAGAEIGLHNDSLGLICRHRLDGVAALRSELAWLRSAGAQIWGTVAHNSAPVCGAEAFEVFREMQLFDRRVADGHGGRLPLGLLSMEELQLEYEGTFATARQHVDRVAAARFVGSAASLDSEAWMRTFLADNPICTWDVDCQAWLVGPDAWVVAGKHGGATLFEWRVSLDRLLALLADMPVGVRCVILVHPAYVRGGVRPS